MSIDDDEYWGAFTHSERDAGIPSLINGTSYERHAEKRDELIRNLRREAVDLISHLNNAEAIRNKILKKLINKDLKVMVYRYARSEKLPEECINLAQQPNALPILLKGFLKKIFRASLTISIADDIDNFSEKLYRNDDFEIVYDRVAKIQIFIHDLADQKYGKDSHQFLPKIIMKNLLSTARLHLNIVDIQNRDSDYLSHIFNQSRVASDAERIAPRAGYIPKGKKHIANWRVLHLMSIMQFQDASVGGKIHGVLALDKHQNVEAFKHEIIEIYSGESAAIGVEEWRQKGRWLQQDDKWDWRY